MMMAKSIRIRMAMDLFVENEQAMRESALQRLRDAWSGDEDFPYAEASDVPFDQVVNSLVADALPIEFSGARRGQLSVETDSDAEGTVGSDEDATTDDRDGSDDGDGSEEEDSDDDSTDEKTEDPVDKQF